MEDQLLPDLEGILRDKLLEVRDYQRPYSWGDRQLRDLWEDIDLLGSSDRHYTGTLVLQRTGRTGRTVAGKPLVVHAVVDGQQRLTTCLILLDQVRRRLDSYRDPGGATDDPVSHAVTELRGLLHVNINGVSRPRLTLGLELNEFFAKQVLGDDPPTQPKLLSGQQRLRAAAEFFASRLHELVSDADDALAVSRLLDLRAGVCFQLGFLVYEVTRSAEVGVIFETLNGRGQDLSEFEKVKNYLFYLARQIQGPPGEDLAQTINKAWSNIFTNMAELKVDDDALLRAHWLATQNPDARNWQGTASVKKKFSRAKYVPTSGRLIGTAEVPDRDDLSERLRDDITTYVDTLSKCSDFFRDLYDERATYYSFAHADADRVRRFSAALVRSGSVAGFRPLLFAARLRHPNDGDSVRQSARGVREIFGSSFCNLRLAVECRPFRALLGRAPPLPRRLSGSGARRSEGKTLAAGT